MPSKQLIAYGGGKAVPGNRHQLRPLCRACQNAAFAMENIITALILFFNRPSPRGWQGRGPLISCLGFFVKVLRRKRILLLKKPSVFR